MRGPSSYLAAAAAVLAVALPGGASALSAVPDEKRVAGVRLTECARGAAVEAGRAEFRGVMRRVEGTERMWMRFTLEERVGDGEFAQVPAPGLEVWRKSRPGVERFVYRQEVLALAEGSIYRVRVHFRWYDGEGRLIRREARRSRKCRQPGMLANLRVGRIMAVPLRGSPNIARYAVQVANRGRGPAEGVEVSLAVDGGAVDVAPVGALAPGEVRRVFVNGPACTTSIEGRVDPRDLVRESSEDDNTHNVPCAS